MPEPQTFETASGQAQQQGAAPPPGQELMLPPQLKNALDKFRSSTRSLRKGFKPTTPDGKALKQQLTNYVLPEAEQALLTLAQAFVETYNLVAYVQADQTQLREHVLTRIGGVPLVDGNVSEEQIAATRRALAELGLALAAEELDRNKLNDAFGEVVACFNDLLDIDLTPYDDDEDDDEDDDDDVTDESDEPAEAAEDESPPEPEGD
jgi:hypothetical protein